MLKPVDPNLSIAQLCRNAPERLRVFENLGLTDDGQPQSLAEVCRTQDLEPKTVARMLAAFEKAGRAGPAVAVELMTLTELCDHLENAQHVLLRRELARLQRLIRAAVKRDAAGQPRLLKLQKAFRVFRKKLTAHLREESRVIFPLVRKLGTAAGGKARARRALKIPAEQMERQHFEADEALAELCALAGDTGALPSASARVRTLCGDILSFEKRFQEELYQENRVLFPRALAAGRHECL